jgi:hypothetical protein
VTLPRVLLEELNRLGFVQIDDERDFVFVRTEMSNQFRLRLAGLGKATWRVGLQWRSTGGLGGLPAAFVAVALGSLGMSSDGDTIDLSTSDVLMTLPRLIEECVLPLVDLPRG